VLAALLQVGFFNQDATSFTVVQMMFATLMLAAFVLLIVFWQTLGEYWRSLWKPR
jgi:isoprenylcysteine carboxyl methyltransferase (ICMT) family protein YpbQ